MSWYFISPSYLPILTKSRDQTRQNIHCYSNSHVAWKSAVNPKKEIQNWDGIKISQPRHIRRRFSYQCGWFPDVCRPHGETAKPNFETSWLKNKLIFLTSTDHNTAFNFSEALFGYSYQYGCCCVGLKTAKPYWDKLTGK